MKNLNIDPIVLSFLNSVRNLSAWEKESDAKYKEAHAKMVDLQHEIEFSEQYDDEALLHLVRHMRQVAKERRMWKDSLMMVRMIKEKVEKGVDFHELEVIDLNASDEWTRNYSPRVLKELDFTDETTLALSRINMIEKEKQL